MGDHILRVKARLRGRTPGMLVNPATDKMLDTLHKGAAASEGTVKGRPYVDVCRERLYRDPDGNLGFPTDNLFAAMVEAGRSVKWQGKRMYSTNTGSVLGGFITFDQDFLPFDKSSLSIEGSEDGEGWVVSRKRGRLPKDGTAVCIVRPHFHNWETEVAMLFDPVKIAPGKVHDILERAGNEVGIGDFRICCKGRYGGFDITSFEPELVPRENTGVVTFDMVRDKFDAILATNGNSVEDPNGDTDPDESESDGDGDDSGDEPDDSDGDDQS